MPDRPTVHIWDDFGQMLVYFILSVLVIAVLYAMKVLIFGSSKKNDEEEK